MHSVIYPEKQGTITASSEDAAYPATNLANNYRKSVWKAGAAVQTATLTIPVSASSASLGAIAWYGSNAVSFSLTITDTTTSATVLSVSETMSARDWREFTPTGNALSASLQLTTTAATVECGIVRAGDVVKFRNPAYGITETLKDYSIKKALRNGAWYTKKLEMARSFGYSMLMLRATDFRTLMGIYEYYGPDPFAILIADNINDDFWTVFGYFATPPNASHISPQYSNVNFSIEETI